MVGSALKELIPNGLFLGSQDCDLRCTQSVEDVFSQIRPTHVIHLAAKVGGIKANMENPASFYYDNIMMNTNVLESARRFRTKKVLSLLSTCVFPDEVRYPLTEDQVHNGAPHQSNYAYAHAKRMLDIQSRAYRDQFGCNFITAIPNNLFGENDNFDLENSHVIPAIIRKMYEAQLANDDVVLWGDGTPLREFTYSQDLARALLLLVSGYEGRIPINVGNTVEISIKDVAEKIAAKIGFMGDIIWNSEMPSGQYRKPSDNSEFRRLFGMKYIQFDEALTNTCKWFIINYPNVRGVE